MVVIARLVMLMVNEGEVADFPAESVTFIVKVEVPREVGVPPIVTELPVLAPKANPLGNVPDATDQVNGATPPVAFTVVL
jgi:hypothetical protein